MQPKKAIFQYRGVGGRNFMYFFFGVVVNDFIKIKTILFFAHLFLFLFRDNANRLAVLQTRYREIEESRQKIKRHTLNKSE